MATATNIVARWETKGKDWLELTRGEKSGTYWYRGNGCGGGFDALNDEAAIARMEFPWGHSEGAGQMAWYGNGDNRPIDRRKQKMWRGTNFESCPGWN